MKDRRPPQNDEPVKNEVSSEDIKNAHAAGDGAMGKGDEKLPDEEGEDKPLDKKPGAAPNVY